MLLVRIVLVLAIAASASGAGEAPSVDNAGSHACCEAEQPVPCHSDSDHDCGGACLMTCCRTVTAPAEPVATAIDQPAVAIRIVAPSLLADDLSEPQAIFHPPRA